MNVRSLDDYRPSPPREITAEDIAMALKGLEECRKKGIFPPPDGSFWILQP